MISLLISLIIMIAVAAVIYIAGRKFLPEFSTLTDIVAFVVLIIGLFRFLTGL